VSRLPVQKTLTFMYLPGRSRRSLRRAESDVRVSLRLRYSIVSVAILPSVPSPFSILSSTVLSDPVAAVSRVVSCVKLAESVSSRAPVFSTLDAPNSVSSRCITFSNATRVCCVCFTTGPLEASVSAFMPRCVASSVLWMPHAGIGVEQQRHGHASHAVEPHAGDAPLLHARHPHRIPRLEPAHVLELDRQRHALGRDRAAGEPEHEDREGDQARYHERPDAH